MSEEKREWPARCLEMRFDQPEDQWMPPSTSETRLILGLPELKLPRWVVWDTQGGFDVIRIYDANGSMIFSLAPDVYFEEGQDDQADRDRD